MRVVHKKDMREKITRSIGRKEKKKKPPRKGDNKKAPQHLELRDDNDFQF